MYLLCGPADPGSALEVLAQDQPGSVTLPSFRGGRGLPSHSSRAVWLSAPVQVFLHRCSGTSAQALTSSLAAPARSQLPLCHLGEPDGVSSFLFSIFAANLPKLCLHFAVICCGHCHLQSRGPSFPHSQASPHPHMDRSLVAHSALEGLCSSQSPV
jgi:hypothetical protein